MSIDPAFAGPAAISYAYRFIEDSRDSKLKERTAQIADDFEEWFSRGAADGFNIMFPELLGSVFDFVDLVVPELQRRGLFRTRYEGATLRDHLGLARPGNRYAARRDVTADVA